MSQLIAMRVRIADVDKSEELNEVWRQPLPHDVPFTTAQRLLGWLRGEVGVISTTQVRRWVQHHGQLIRQAEQVEVQAVLEHESLSDWQAGLAPRQAPRRPAAREQTFKEAMEHALAQPDQSPPAGVSASDWERVR